MTPANIWKPTTISFETPLGTLYFSGFMSMFGAGRNQEWHAVSRMQVATEAQVHYTIDTAFS
jgi:hypothetical protein